MSQISLTQIERVRALRRFSYSEPEASFLCLAGLHGGYFLRRQYAQFLGRRDGGSVTQLTEKALAQGHVRASTWRQKTQLYHLCARPFYEALGQADNRNRRVREFLTIKNKIMGLDFVLAHRRYQYLATEQEKLDYFSGILKLDRSILPTKLYRSRQSDAVSARYFVDKYPIFLPTWPEASLTEPMSSGEPPVVAFCYVDEGTVSLSRFESYLAQYGGLFSSLPGFFLTYVAAGDVHFHDAQRAFERFSYRGGAPDCVDRSVSAERLLDYFKARRLYETKQLASFDRAKLIRLRQDQKDFASAKHEALFARWKTEGDRSVLEIAATETAARPRVRGTFSTYLLEQDYGLFGNFPG